MIRYGTEALGLGILKHLKLRHGNADISTTIELRQDVYQYLFTGKGAQSGRRGYINMEKQDFSRCNFPSGWECVVDKLGDGKKVVFPIRLFKLGTQVLCYDKPNIGSYKEVSPGEVEHLFCYYCLCYKLN